MSLHKCFSIVLGSNFDRINVAINSLVDISNPRRECCFIGSSITARRAASANSAGNY